MDGFPRRLLAAALLALGLTAPATAVRSPQPPVRLLAPAEGAVLTAGSIATLGWAPSEGIAGTAREWDEWEAFLSLDGGATYPVRITPHLDRTLRQVTFRVPNLPTRNGRLLLRVGDEHREIAFELPERFTIAPARLETSPASLFSPSWSASRRGEPARPGDPGVLSWVEGSRQGGPVREVLAEVTAEPARAVPGVSWREGTSLPAGVSAETPPSGAPATNPDTPETLPPPRSMAAPHARAPRREAADLLLLIQRQNE